MPMLRWIVGAAKGIMASSAALNMAKVMVGNAVTPSPAAASAAAQEI